MSSTPLPALSRAAPDSWLATVEAALRARDGTRPNGPDELIIRCLEPKAHKHGDRKPSATWNIWKGIGTCHGCGASWNTKQAAELLGVHLPANLQAAPERTWEIRGRDGVVAGVHHRRDKPDSKEVWWSGPNGESKLGRPVASMPLYGSHRLDKFDRDRPAFVVEGEPATDALLEVGCQALGTVTGASSCPSPEVLSDLSGLVVVIWPDNDEPGRQHMARLARVLPQASRLRPIGDPGSGDDAADFVGQLRAEGRTGSEIRDRVESLSETGENLAAEKTRLAGLAALAAEPPRPLRREIPPAEPYPLSDLPPTIREAVEAIHEITQAPLAVCAQSTLAAAALAAQAHYDVRLPHGARRPCSCYFVTVAESGERKTTADSLAMRAINEREQAMAAYYAQDLQAQEAALTAWEKQRQQDLRKAGTLTLKREALSVLGPKPEMPPPPLLVAPEPTIEGIHRLYAEGIASLGLFATEGGQFLGGHGMNREHRFKTAAALSAQWDGEPVRRVRAGDGAHRLAGRRLSVHLQMQPRVSQGLLADQELLDQGLVSRILVSAPESTAGSRFWREPPSDAGSRLGRFANAVAALLRRTPRFLDSERGALDPLLVTLTDDGKRLWTAFADDVEKRLGRDGELAQVRGLASKLPEHAARVALVMASVERPDLTDLTGEDLARGIALMRYYATEALRLHEIASGDPDLELAEKALRWMRLKKLTCVALVTLYQKGPRVLRDAKSSRKAANILVDHGYLVSLPAGTEIDGTPRKEAWELVEC